MDVTRDPSGVRSRIGLVFQDPSLDAQLTGRENLEFHCFVYHVPKAQRAERIKRVLEMVDLADRADSLAMTYSGGMKRRLEIARGVLHTPEVLFLDEPTIGLDPQTRRGIWGYLRALPRKEGTTLFMTTHYMEEAEYCDRIAIIDKGRIIAIDTPNALKASVGADTITLATADDELAVTQIAERLHVPVERVADQIVVRIAHGEGFVPKIFDAIDVPVHSVNVRRPSLDDVFIKYTGHEMRDGDGQQAQTAVARAHQSR
jgi:ABC-2 type transport system ATP-binding protein